jgi:hypothetical protein
MTNFIFYSVIAKGHSKSPQKGGDFKKHFKALSYGEGWVRLLASYLAMTLFYLLLLIDTAFLCACKPSISAKISTDGPIFWIPSRVICWKVIFLTNESTDTPE